MKLEWFVKEITWLGASVTGWGNGYVAIPEGHPLFGMHYDKIHRKYESLSIHGGLTYSEKGTADTWIPQEHVGKWIIGFDCSHYMDTPESWPRERVEQEAAELARQCEEILNLPPVPVYEPGTYWVKKRIDSEWEVASKDTEWWSTWGSNDLLNDDDFEEIGPKIHRNH